MTPTVKRAQLSKFSPLAAQKLLKTSIGLQSHYIHAYCIKESARLSNSTNYERMEGSHENQLFITRI